MRLIPTLLRSLGVVALAAVAGLGVQASAGAPALAAQSYEPVPDRPAVEVPDKPRAWATCVWATAVRVNWYAVSGNGSFVRAYEVRALDRYGREVSERTVSSYTRRADLNRLRPGQRYTVQVRAQNAGGWGPWSNGDAVYTAW